MQWQPLVLPSYRGDSRAVFVVGPAGRHASKICCVAGYCLVFDLHCLARGMIYVKCRTISE
jgi:hypothetical protein